MNSFEHLQNQLDLLTGLLEVSDIEVYDLIKDHRHFSRGCTMEELFKKNSENFSNMITTSALLLGLSHFEDFLGKCIAVILTNHPDKNDLRVSLKVFLDKSQNIIPYLANEQAKKLPFSEKITFIEKNLPGIDTNLMNEIKIVYNIRNCIMHNNGHADATLSAKYSDKEKIVLNPNDVNVYGLIVRKSAKDVWNRLSLLYNIVQ